MDNPRKESDEERYSRQEIITFIGKEGQEKIKKTHIMIIGVGALGTVAAELAARAGVGRVTLVDRDVIELSNLQRQTLFTEKDIGRSKAVAAAEKIREINSTIKIDPAAIDLTVVNSKILGEADLILDCTDNLQTRFLINHYCRKNNKSWIYAAAIRAEGYVMALLPDGPCLRCFLNTPPSETCATTGVLNTVTTAIATQQVTLALKMIVQGKNSIAKDELIHFNIWENILHKIKIHPKKNCQACQGKEDPNQYENKTKLISFCSTGRYQINGKVKDLSEAAQHWQKMGPLSRDEETISFQNILLFKDGRALIKAGSEEEARGIYDKWVGN